jgi:hypothetical protein
MSRKISELFENNRTARMFISSDYRKCKDLCGLFSDRPAGTQTKGHI